MKLSNKILIAVFSFFLILTFITMVKIRSLQKEYNLELTQGNKNWITAEFPLQEFTQLEVGDHFDVKWHKGLPLVKVRIEENLKPHFRANQIGQKVEIRFDSVFSIRLNGKIIVDVYSQTLEQIKLKDFVQFASLDTLHSKEFKLEMEDHCAAEILSSSENMNLHLSDFCDLSIIGTTNLANIKMKDHSNMDAEHLDILNATVDLEDFSNASIAVRIHLKAQCLDHSNLSYKGDSLVAEVIQKDFSNISKEQ